MRIAFHDGSSAAAREDMALASLLGGLALANAGLGAVHGLAAPVGGMFSAPHGAVCAALLPHVMEANLQAARRRAATGEVFSRYWASRSCGASASPPAQFQGSWPRRPKPAA